MAAQLLEVLNRIAAAVVAALLLLAVVVVEILQQGAVMVETVLLRLFLVHQ